MSILAEFTVPAEEFVLADTLISSPDMRIEIKRVVGGKSTVTPYFWASGGDFDTFEEALRSDEMIREVLTLEEHEDQVKKEDQEEERFYRVIWEMDIPNLISAVSDAKATVLEAVSGDHETWAIKLLFPNHDSLSHFREYCVEHDFEVQPTRIYRPDNPQEQAEYDLTEEQQVALEAAYRLGYFAVPREHTLTEIAEELEISRNALSTRLRRGHRNLLSNTIIHEE